MKNYATALERGDGVEMDHDEAVYWRNKRQDD